MAMYLNTVIISICNLDKINEEIPKKDAANNTLWEKERNPAKSLTTTGSRHAHHAMRQATFALDRLFVFSSRPSLSRKRDFS